MENKNQSPTISPPPPFQPNIHFKIVISPLFFFSIFHALKNPSKQTYPYRWKTQPLVFNLNFLKILKTFLYLSVKSLYKYNCT